MELREKLRLAMAAAPVRRASTIPPPAPRVPAGHQLGTLPVERRATASGDVHIAEQRWPLQHRHGRRALGDALAIDGRALTRLATRLSPADIPRAAFLDIETTGLSGGTGTLAFLVGVATFEDEAVCLRQFFLADPGGEEAMLSELSSLIGGCAAVVSFNGRCFDVPLLETRLILNRLRSPFEGMEHVDLLHATRRLYRHRLESCRLAAVEQHLLGAGRQRDVPGWAVPGIYLDYLRRGETTLLRDIFLHNKLDVLSLVTLLAHVGEGVRSPAEPGDCLALARWDEARGRSADAAEFYRRALEDAPVAGERIAAARGLVRTLRRLERWDEVELVLAHEMTQRQPTEVRLWLLVEAAKLREHRQRDFRAAEALTREAMELVRVASLRPGSCGPAIAELEKRLWRLLRRQRRTGRAAVLADRSPRQAAAGP